MGRFSCQVDDAVLETKARVLFRGGRGTGLDPRTLGVGVGGGLVSRCGHQAALIRQLTQATTRHRLPSGNLHPTSTSTLCKNRTKNQDIEDAKSPCPCRHAATAGSEQGTANPLATGCGCILQGVRRFPVPFTLLFTRHGASSLFVLFVMTRPGWWEGGRLGLVGVLGSGTVLVLGGCTRLRPLWRWDVGCWMEVG